jgi:cell division transport system permease protein
MSRLTFFISEAFRALRRQAAPSLAATVSIVVTTLLLGVLIPVLRASEGTANEVREQIGVNVFLYSDANRADVERVHKKIKAIPHVAALEYVSPQEGLKQLSKDLDKEGSGGLTDELPGNQNPIPPAFRVDLDDPDNLEAVTADLQPAGANGEPKPLDQVIQEVRDARADASDIRKVTGAVKIILIVIGALLLVASLLLVANTIRLSIYARRREVEVMRLVGATNWFIRWPFVIEGMLVGLAGAVVAVGLLTLGKLVIVDPLADDFDLINNFGTMPFLPLVLALVGSAIIVSALGSGVTLRRFLRI